MKIFYTFFFSLIPVLLSSQSHWETAVYSNDIWKYKIFASEPSSDWKSGTFNDSDWLSGKGGIGYGDNDDSTVISSTISVYLRKSFNIPDTSKILSGILNIDFDDGFVANLNNFEIARSNVTGNPPAYNKSSDTDHEALMPNGGTPETFLITKENLKKAIKQGDNVLAIQVHNLSATSSDMSSNAFLSFEITDDNTFFSNPPSWFKAPKVFTSSNLPVVLINTANNQNIPDAYKINAQMKIIDNGVLNNISDPPNIYNGHIGIEIRGSYSASLPQKPYGFETRDTSGENNNVSLLGMPKENDWILLANYNDKTFLRNALSFDLFRKMGHWAPRTRHCEVSVNNDYQGIYVLTEKIKRDNGRVNIAKLDIDDNAGDSVTGGYILKIDYIEGDGWYSSYSPYYTSGDAYFVYHDPKPEELTTQQKAYIKNFMDSFEGTLYGNDFKNPLTGYRSYINVTSFIDYFLIGELSRNVDAYKKSSYFFKNTDKKGGLLNMGPVWDFDWAWINLRECFFNQVNGAGWAYQIHQCNPNPVPPDWMSRLLEDDYFKNNLYTRYFNLRKNILSETSIFNYIDSVKTLLNEAQERHYEKWDILGVDVGAPEVDAQPLTFEGDIQKFKNWISTRLSWLDANMPGTMISSNLNENIICRVFPNPAKDFVFIESEKEIKSLAIFNVSGIIVQRMQCNDYSIMIDIKDFSPGIYIIRLVNESNEIINTRFIIN